MVPDPTVPVVSWAGRSGSAARPRRTGTASFRAVTGSIRVRVGSGLAGTRSTGTVSAGGTVRPVAGAGAVLSGTSSTAVIPDVTDAIRPSAAPATNTMTTPSAVKKPSCSMIRMYTVLPAGEPPMVTWLFH